MFLDTSIYLPGKKVGIGGSSVVGLTNKLLAGYDPTYNNGLVIMNLSAMMAIAYFIFKFLKMK